MLACAAEEDNEEGKIKGYVHVVWRVHKLEPPHEKSFRYLAQIYACAPLRLAAFHLCRPISNTSFEISNINKFSKLVLPFLKTFGAIHFFRSHYGSAQECKYKLLSYGCPICFPIQEGITSDTSSICPFHNRYSKEWIAKRMQIESAKSQKLSVLLNTVKGCDIRPNDVLLGRITLVRNHSGNTRLRQLVADNFDNYHATCTSRRQKMKMAKEIALQIKRDGGRFLKQTKKDEGGLWVEASDDEARTNVASTFRNIVKKKKRESE